MIADGLISSVAGEVIAVAIIAICSSALTLFGALRFAFRKERRIYKNVKRPIFVWSGQKHSIEHENNMLKNVDFFNLGDGIHKDARASQLLKNERLAIMRYETSDSFREVFRGISEKRIPIIVYCNPGEIPLDSDDMRLIRGYSFHSFCNTPVRLISDVFAVNSTFPEDEK